MMEIDPKALIAVLAGDASDEERVLVERWRASSSENELEFLRRERMWALLGALDLPTESSDAIGVPPSTGASSWSGRSRRVRGIAAAGMLAAAMLAVILIQHGQPFADRFEPLAAADVVTGPEEVRTVQLSDGTVVRMGPDSRLGVTDAVGPRDVFVEGQAYFVVPGGQPHPFRVHSNQGQVAVLGTRFEVAARGDEIQVLVVEGEVELEANEETVSLRKGQAGTAAESSALVVDTVSDIYGMTAWLGTFAAYEETPLIEIAEEFRRRFEYEIEIVDAGLADRTVSGMMRDQSVEDMAANVCIAVGARCSFEPGRVRMEIDRAARATSVRPEDFAYRV